MLFEELKECSCFFQRAVLHTKGLDRGIESAKPFTPAAHKILQERAYHPYHTSLNMLVLEGGARVHAFADKGLNEVGLERLAIAQFADDLDGM